MNSSFDVNDELGESKAQHSHLVGPASASQSDQDGEGFPDVPSNCASNGDDDVNTKRIEDALKSWKDIGKLASSIGAFALRHKVQTIRQRRQRLAGRRGNTIEQKKNTESNGQQQPREKITNNISSPICETKGPCPDKALGSGDDTSGQKNIHKENTIDISFAECDKKKEGCAKLQNDGGELDAVTRKPSVCPMHASKDETSHRMPVRVGLAQGEGNNPGDGKPGKKRPLCMVSPSQSSVTEDSTERFSEGVAFAPDSTSTGLVATESTSHASPPLFRTSANQGILPESNVTDPGDGRYTEESDEYVSKKKRVLKTRENADGLQAAATTTQEEDIRMQSSASRPSMSDSIVEEGSYTRLKDDEALSQLARLNLLWKQYQTTQAQLAGMFEDIIALESCSKDGCCEDKEEEAKKKRGMEP